MSEFDAESARAAFERLPNARLLYQFHAEGSLIRAEAGDELDGRVTLSERADVEHRNHFLAVVNAERGAVLARGVGAHAARRGALVQPVHARPRA